MLTERVFEYIIKKGDKDVNVSKEEVRALAKDHLIGGGMVINGNSKRRISNDDLMELWNTFHGLVEKMEIVNPAFEIHEIHLIFDKKKYVSFLIIKQKKDYSNGVGAPRSPFHGLCTFEITRSDF